MLFSTPSPSVWKCILINSKAQLGTGNRRACSSCILAIMSLFCIIDVICCSSFCTSGFCISACICFIRSCIYDCMPKLLGATLSGALEKWSLQGYLDQLREVEGLSSAAFLNLQASHGKDVMVLGQGLELKLSQLTCSTGLCKFVTQQPVREAACARLHCIQLVGKALLSACRVANGTALIAFACICFCLRHVQTPAPFNILKVQTLVWHGMRHYQWTDLWIFHGFSNLSLALSTATEGLTPPSWLPSQLW